MPRTRIATRKSVGPPRGQSSSSQPPAAPTQNEEVPEVRRKAVQDRGKGPAASESESEERSSQAKSESETETEVQEESDEEMGNAEEP